MEIAKGILAGDRASLAKGITLVESTRAEDYEQARQLIETLYPRTGNSLRIGITGVPGSGKSSLINYLGLNYINFLG